MHPQQTLSPTPLVLSQQQRDFYFQQGYVVKQNAIDHRWLEPLNAGLAALVERSRQLTQSDGTFDLEPDHSAGQPRLRRIAYLDDLDPLFWDFCQDSPLVDLAVDLLGPNIRFREALVNFKWARGGQAVRWHQDFPFYPLTNRSVAQFLVCLDDVGPEQGPLQVVPGSHKGPFYDHYDRDGNWLGYIEDCQLATASLDTAVELTGTAGMVTVHDCATLHASGPNLSARGRPLLIVTYCACDAMAYTAVAYPSSHCKMVVRGEEARFARLEAMQMRMPPDWSGGYTSIFEHQKKG